MSITGVTLSKLIAQQFLFRRVPRRAELATLDTEGWPTRTLDIAVSRNHALELMLPLINTYLRYAGCEPRWHLGPYDDTLLLPVAGGSDVRLIWLDLDRLDAERSDLVDAVRNAPGAPRGQVIVIPISDQPERIRDVCRELAGLPGVRAIDPEPEVAATGIGLIDRRLARLAGTPVGRDAQAVLARSIGCQWLPASFSPPLKLICVDLDDTLHRGVIAEDGSGGVHLDQHHRELVEALRRCRESGIMIALVSRNDPRDVHAHLAIPPPGGLGVADFDFVHASWEPKSVAVGALIERTRIGNDAVVMIDDKETELVEVVGAHPGLSAILGGRVETPLALACHPGISRPVPATATATRVADLLANEQRDLTARTSTDVDELHRQLQVEFEVTVDDPASVPRVADLSARTNQFNLTLSRIDEATANAFLNDDSAAVVTVAARDRMADSGIIAIALVRQVDDDLEVIDLCISCRALGRQLEDTIVSVMLETAHQSILGSANGRADRATSGPNVLIHVSHGPRNEPARAWLSRLVWSDHPDRWRDHPDICIPLSEFTRRRSAVVPVRTGEVGRS